MTFDWTPLSQFDDETPLATRVVAPFSDIMSVELDAVKKSRGKILLWRGGAGPQALFDTIVNWVENGVAPDRILAQNTSQGGGVTRTRPLCPYPQTAIYTGGDINSASSFRCGGNLETKENVCMDLVTKFQKETKNALDPKGMENPGACKAGSHGRDDDDDADDRRRDRAD